MATDARTLARAGSCRFYLSNAFGVVLFDVIAYPLNCHHYLADDGDPDS
jgi:hypothetical protein